MAATPGRACARKRRLLQVVSNGVFCSVDDEVVGPEKEERVMRSNWLYLIVLPAAATFTAAQRFDVQFDAARSHWAGTRTRDGRAIDVMLERPRRPRGAGPNEFCGAWDESDDELSPPFRPPAPQHNPPRAP